MWEFERMNMVWVKEFPLELLFTPSSFSCHTLFTFQLRSSFLEVKRNNRNSCDSEISAAELKKSELVAAKENLDRRLASNYQIKAQLQKQLQNILVTQAQERGKPRS